MRTVNKRCQAVFFLAIMFLFIPFFVGPHMKSYAAQKWYCKACGQELTYDRDTETYYHGNTECENFGKNPDDNPGLFTTDQSAAGGSGSGTESGDGTGDNGAIPDDKKSVFQNTFENYVFATAFDMGDSNGTGFTPAELLEKTFVYALAILEGTDHIPSGYIDTDTIPFSRGIVHESWYIFLQVAAMIIMLIRFCYDYATVRVWTPASPQTPEHLFKPIFKLICGFILIVAAHYILAFFLYLSQAAVGAFVNHVSSNDGSTAQVFDQLKADLCVALGFEVKGMAHGLANLGALLTGIIILLLPLVANMAYTVVMLGTIFSRIFEVILRGIMVPLAMTDVHEEHGGNAMRYTMEFAAVCFQGLLILLSIWVANMVCAFLIENILTQIPTGTNAGFLKAVGSIGTALAAIKFAQIAFIGRTRSIAQSVFTR